MISVQNRLQLLSGSRIVLLFLVGLLLFSCGTQKKATKRTPSKRPTTKKPVKKRKSKVDTIEWKEVDKTTKSNSNEPTSNRKSSYRVAMFMPLEGRSTFMENEKESLEKYINYYAGVKMALIDLNRKSINIHVNVYDDSKGFDKLIYSPGFKNNDIIIGPRKRDKLKKVIGIGKRDQTLVVSPWFSSSRLTENNPYYLQLNPSTKDRYEALLVHAKQHFQNENIFVIQRNEEKDKRRSQYFQKLNQTIENQTIEDQIITPLEIFTVDVDSLEQGVTAFDEMIMQEEEREIAIIIPNWSSADEYYLYSCLRKLSVEKGLNKFTVYTMSRVLESDLINYELYKNLNIRIAAVKYVQPEDPSVISFRKRYYNEYNALATDDAIEGYDMMTFIGNNLIKHGNTFPYFLTQPERQMQIQYDIHSKHSATDIKNEKFDNVQYFINKHVDIIEFNDNNFHRQ